MTDATAAGCGTCTLCCKIMHVPELEKPYGEWCGYCERRGRGCTVYETRPQSCRDFDCVWLQSQGKPGSAMPPELRPDRSHVVLATGTDGRTLIAHVDVHYPNAWEHGAIGRFLRGLIGRRDLPVVIATGRHRRAFNIGAAPIAFVDRDTAKGKT